MALEANKNLNNNLLEGLKNQARLAFEEDANPFLKSYEKNELISEYAHYFPEIDRLSYLKIKTASDGWITANDLLNIAELAQKYGTGLLEFLNVDKEIAILGLKPEKLSKASKHLGKNKCDTESTPNINIVCQDFKDYLVYQAIIKELQQQIETDFFPLKNQWPKQDIKMILYAGKKINFKALINFDLGIVALPRKKVIEIWSGGKVDLFGSSIAPKKLLKIDMDLEQKNFSLILDELNNIFDLWSFKAKKGISLSQFFDKDEKPEYWFERKLFHE